MRWLTPLLILFAACVSCGPSIETPRTVPAQAEPCGGIIDLHVVNENPGDVRVSFPGWKELAAIVGFSQKTIEVPETSLERQIGLKVVRGGSGQATISGGNVDCNEATLIIGSPVRISFFFGADVRRQP